MRTKPQGKRSFQGSYDRLVEGPDGNSARYLGRCQEGSREGGAQCCLVGGRQYVKEFVSLAGELTLPKGHLMINFAVGAVGARTDAPSVFVPYPLNTSVRIF